MIDHVHDDNDDDCDEHLEGSISLRGDSFTSCNLGRPSQQRSCHRDTLLVDKIYLKYLDVDKMRD